MALKTFGYFPKVLRLIPGYAAGRPGPFLAVLLGEELHVALSPVPLAPRRLQRDALLGVLDRRGEGAEVGVASGAVAVRRGAGPRGPCDAAQGWVDK